MNTRTSLIFLALSLSACRGPVSEANAKPTATAPTAATTEEEFPRPGGVYDWCDINTCVSCPPNAPCPPVGTASIIHCCNAAGVCVHVQLMGSCDPDDYVVICRWGQTNEDGTITCYE